MKPLVLLMAVLVALVSGCSTATAEPAMEDVIFRYDEKGYKCSKVVGVGVKDDSTKFLMLSGCVDA